MILILRSNDSIFVAVKEIFLFGADCKSRLISEIRKQAGQEYVVETL